MSKKKKTKTQKFWQRTPILATSIGLLVFLCFLPGAFYDFINIDDFNLIVNNSLVKTASLFDFKEIFTRQIYTPHYKPLVYMTWISERSLFGINAHVLHFNNAVLHGINSALVFLLSLKILPRMWPKLKNYVPAAALCALAWGLHPLRIESVTWAVERKDVLFGFFYLLACLNYIKYLSSGRNYKYFLFALLFFMLSCLSKSMGITFLATAILLEILFDGINAFKGKALLPKAPMTLVAVVMLHLYGFILAPDVEGTRVVNAAKQNIYVPDAIHTNSKVLQFASIANMRMVGLAAHTVLPVKLAVVYPREHFIQWLAIYIHALFAVPLFFLFLLYFKKHLRPSVGFGLFWYALTIAPILVADGTGTNFLSDRYTYIPSLGIIWICIPAILFFFNKRIAKSLTSGQVISAAIITLLAIGTITGMKYWKTSQQLWTKVIETYPNNWYAYYNRAKLMSDKNPELALSDLNKSIEFLSNQSVTFYTRGTIYMQEGNYAAAISDFTNAINIKSDYVESRINLASSYRSLKQYQNAIDHYNVALGLEKMQAIALNGRGATYKDMGNLQLALDDFNQVIQLYPEHHKAYLNRANIFMLKEFGQLDRAIEDFNYYISEFPEDHMALFRRGFAKAQLNRHQEALVDFNTAISIFSTQGFYYFGRAQSLEKLGRNQEALNDLRQAQQLNVAVDPAMLTRLQNQ
jgi:protein O-mannosyl-transferase